MQAADDVRELVCVDCLGSIARHVEDLTLCGCVMADADEETGPPRAFELPGVVSLRLLEHPTVQCAPGVPHPLPAGGHTRHVVPCRVVSCRAKSCQVVPCRAMSCHEERGTGTAPHSCSTDINAISTAPRARRVEVVGCLSDDFGELADFCSAIEDHAALEELSVLEANLGDREWLTVCQIAERKPSLRELRIVASEMSTAGARACFAAMRERVARGFLLFVETDEVGDDQMGAARGASVGALMDDESATSCFSGVLRA